MSDKGKSASKQPLRRTKSSKSTGSAGGTGSRGSGSSSKTATSPRSSTSKAPPRRTKSLRASAEGKDGDGPNALDVLGRTSGVSGGSRKSSGLKRSKSVNTGKSAGTGSQGGGDSGRLTPKGKGKDRRPSATSFASMVPVQVVFKDGSSGEPMELMTAPAGTLETVLGDVSRMSQKKVLGFRRPDETTLLDLSAPISTLISPGDHIVAVVDADGLPPDVGGGGGGKASSSLGGAFGILEASAMSEGAQSMDGPSHLQFTQDKLLMNRVADDLKMLEDTLNRVG